MTDDPHPTRKTIISTWATTGPIQPDDVLALLSVVERPDGVMERRRVTLDDVVRLLANEIERRQRGG